MQLLGWEEPVGRGSCNHEHTDALKESECVGIAMLISLSCGMETPSSSGKSMVIDIGMTRTIVFFVRKDPERVRPKERYRFYYETVPVCQARRLMPVTE